MAAKQKQLFKNRKLMVMSTGGFWGVISKNVKVSGEMKADDGLEALRFLEDAAAPRNVW